MLYWAIGMGGCAIHPFLPHKTYLTSALLLWGTPKKEVSKGTSAKIQTKMFVFLPPINKERGKYLIKYLLI